VHTFSPFKFRFLGSEKQTAIIVLILCIAVRTLPELAAYPHPIGYDVVNYYIPKVADFEEQWGTISKQFPLYVTILFSLSTATGIPPPSIVVFVAVAMAGIFGVSLFYIGRNLLDRSIIVCVARILFNHN
jgi:hypothetical protein